ncbi:lytic transglycosylase domain-containing protein [Acidiphilium sp. PM]|uniref:lytic transglycosylase domain-containing protein n=1 Tax=Acidiphilium sp. PM TaxID=1043206 RepID=UPI00021448A5|nr:lytic transglycosylase domain-containing protein [Acidiphilium sp. PM]EGO93214.1 Lytic transglycosylase, catalytic [Acidiphilium sp. PM]
MLITPAHFLALANRCAPEVAPGTLAAVASTESGFNTLAIHDNTTRQSMRPSDVRNAIAVARRLIADGHSVDLGLMQIDSANLPRLGLTVPTAFDACASIRAGGKLLAQDYKRPDGQGRQAALLAALSRYNTGSAWQGFQNGYVSRVVSTAKYVVPEIDPADSNQAPKARPSSASSTPRPPAWDVFPNSIGPAGFASAHAVTLQASRASGPSGRAQPSNQETRGETKAH